VYRSRSHLERDLGIMIDSELNFSEHMHMVSKNTNGIMAVIKRTFTCLDFEQWRSHGGGPPTCPKDRLWDSSKSGEKLVRLVGGGTTLK